MRRLASRRILEGELQSEEHFFAEQNARLVKNAEEYYRSMFRGRPSSWNLRDSHMMETLRALLDFLNDQAPGRKAVVWAHNSHLGDARATEMSQRGEINLGQLVRERMGADSMLVGFSTFTGTVMAASDWDGPHETKPVRPGLPNSYEALFHEVGMPSFLLQLRDNATLKESLRPRRLQRAIGVIYRPHTERFSHYFGTVLPEQFDALVHFDETRAIAPLDDVETIDPHELPETYPSAV
jgi:erythromycin esterase-like protein